MAASLSSNRSRKQWALTETETIHSFESWKANLIFNFTLDKVFKAYLKEDATWNRVKAGDQFRGFTTTGTGENRVTAAEKVELLELMLAQIANFAPIINRDFIIKQSRSLKEVWQVIRKHYGFKASGAYFLDIARIRYDPVERPETLYQRIYAAVQDSLLKTDGGLTHNGEAVEENEVITPTIENFIVLTWLQLIHPGLPALVKQHYGPQLKKVTLASLQEEISDSLDSLLETLSHESDIKACRMEARNKSGRYAGRQERGNRDRRRAGNRNSPSCPICLQAGRPRHDHYLTSCSYLPESDKRYLASRNRMVEVEDTYDSDRESTADDYADNTSPDRQHPPHVSRVSVKASPHIKAFHGHQVAKICLDSGAEADVIREDEARRLGIHIRPNRSQRPTGADGGAFLDIVGECSTTFHYRNAELTFNGLVSRRLASPIIAGMPFLEDNDIQLRFNQKKIILGDGTTIPFGHADHRSDRRKPYRVMTIQSPRDSLIRAPQDGATIWPGSHLELELPIPVPDDHPVTLEPRRDTSSPLTGEAGGSTRSTPAPPRPRPPSTAPRPFSNAVKLDPDRILTDKDRHKLARILQKHDEVFNPAFKGYNGASGPFKAKVNMGPCQPPQRKGRIPMYSHSTLIELQEQLDCMEDKGVLAKPEDIGVVVEYLNHAFLVSKANGGKRVVTAFTDVAKYCKPQPSLLPDVNQVLRRIAQWKFIIITDMASAYFQIPLDFFSQKYCGISTPFKGTRVYQRCAMGMPGSETALEELMSRVLGHLIMEGAVAKLADDLYCGGNSIPELIHNWERTLEALAKNDLRLSGAKTIICPRRARVLGWIWSNGTISADPHTINALATCDRPTTVKDLRSFVGSFKALARVIPGAAAHVAPLDDVIAGKDAKDKLSWPDADLAAFKEAQKALSTHQCIVLPTPEDTLWLVTDAAVRPTGIGATLYVKREDIVRAAGFFSCKLKPYQRRWLPCELEALAIGTAVNHFKPYYVQSGKVNFILTDSKPCVEAIAKLERGEFSASPRVTTFLSAVSRFPFKVLHLSGKSNLTTDFASRHPMECGDSACQVCQFVENLSASPVINRLGNEYPAYANRPAWKLIQSECNMLRRTYAHLSQGTRPSKKETKIRDVKTYLQHSSIASDGLLVVKSDSPFGSSRDRVVVPRGMIHGLLTSLHIKMDHPSNHQLRQLFNRSFYALAVDQAICRITDACTLCQATRNAVHVPQSYASDYTPTGMFQSFAADIMLRSRQAVLVVRETVSSYTEATIIPDESATSIREGLLVCIARHLLQDGPAAVVRTDPGPGFQALTKDPILDKMGVRPQAPAQAAQLLCVVVWVLS